MPPPPIAAFDITTSCELFTPERLFAIVGELNARRGPDEQVGIELYPTRHSPIGPLRPERILDWQRRSGANVVRVHLEFALDQAEIRHIIRGADRHRGPWIRMMLRVLYWMMADARSGLGLRLARGLGVGVNVHSNVIEGLARAELLRGLASRLPFVWAENNIRADYLHVRGPVLFDPRVIADQQVERYGLDGLLLAVDHLVDHYAAQNINPIEVLDDEGVRAWTRAMHLAGRSHAPLRIGDPLVEKLLRKLRETAFRTPVRIVLDYNTLQILQYSFRDEVRLFQDTIEWISDVVGRA